MINEKLLETGLSLSEIIIITLAFEEEFDKLESLFKYRQEEFQQLKEKLDKELYIKTVGDKIIVRERASAYFTVASFESFLEEFINIFPAKTKAGSGEFLRCKPSEIANKMKRLITLHKLERERILEVTKVYVAEQAEKGFMYARTANYFLEKNRVSTLLAYYENHTVEEKAKLTHNQTLINFE